MILDHSYLLNHISTKESLVLCFNCGFAVNPVIMDQESSLNPGHNGEPIALIGQVPQTLQHVVIRPILYIRNRVAKAFVVLSVFFLLLWISAFLYGSLYYSYMPNAAFSTAVHYYYRYLKSHLPAPKL